jgi:hypothetical protein
MILDTRFKFTIIDYTTNPLGDSTVIDEPVGWDGVLFELQRLETHGFVNRLNVDGITFEFHTTAKDILVAAYDAYGVEAQVELKIEYKGKPSDAYTQIYLGLFKFSSYKKVCGFDCKVSCGVVQSGKYYLFHNRKNQPVDLSSLTSFDGDVLPAYIWLNKLVNIPAKNLRLLNDLECVPNGFGENLGVLSCNIFSVDRYNIFINFFFDVINTIQLNDQLTVESIIMYDNSAITPTNNILQEYVTNGGSPFYQRNGENENIICNNIYELYLNFNVDLLFDSLTPTTFEIPQVSMYAWIMKVDGTIDMIYTGAPQSCPPGSSLVTLNFTDNILIGGVTMEIGDQLFMGAVCIDAQGSFCIPAPCDLSVTVYQNLFEYNLVAESSCEDTSAKVSLINEVFARQIESYTNNEMTIKSDYFGRTDAQPYVSLSDGCGSLESLSKGLQIRGAKNVAGVEYSLIASFEDTFKNANGIHNIGYGVEDDSVRRGAGFECIRIEPYEYFYQSSILLTIDYPNEAETSVEQEVIYQGINVGYNIWATEEEGGLQDLYTSRVYNTGLTRTSNDVSVTSDFVASDFAIEVSRRMFGTSRKDFNYDDNVFIMCMYRDGINIYVEVGDTEVSPGIPLINTSDYIYSPETLKNSRITPVRNLMRHVSRLIRYLKPSLTWEFKFKEGKANYIAGIEHNPNPCAIEDVALGKLYENENINVSSFDDSADGTPILSSETITFSYPLNCEEWNDIIANPYGRIGYICPQDVSYSYGWIKNLQYNPTKGLATFTLIKEYT